MRNQYSLTHRPILVALSARSQCPGPGTHLACTVAALPRQVLPMNQRACGSATLQGEPGIDESGGTGVVVDKKGLGNNTCNQ